MKRLRLYFLALFVLLSGPFLLLVFKTHKDLQREVFLTLRKSAETAMAGASERMIEILQREANRSFIEYRFFQAGTLQLPDTRSLHLSPLAELPPPSDVPGILGYFQIDPDRTFHTPLLPDPRQEHLYKLPDRPAREDLRSRLFQIVSSALLTGSEDSATGTRTDRATLLAHTDTRLLENLFSARASLAPTAGEASQLALQENAVSRPKLQSSSREQLQAFDTRADRYVRFSFGRGNAVQTETTDRPAPFSKAKPSSRPLVLAKEAVVTEIDPFQVSLAESAWLVFYRSVWWEERRYVQGFVTSLKEFTENTVGRSVGAQPLTPQWHYLVLHGGEVVQERSAADPAAEKPYLIHWAATPYPLSAFSIAVSVDSIPRHKGAPLLLLFSAFFALLLCGSLYATYRMAAVQLELSAKKSDFVSAVSHELKTPLTSIRMYGDLLAQGWADEEKRKTYLQFIQDESERLTRLIENVLQIAQLERGHWQLKLMHHNPADLVGKIVTKVRDAAARSNVELSFSADGTYKNVILDEDAFTQIFLNVIDNAIKYSGSAEKKRVDVRVVQAGDECLVRVRDYGPGIPQGSLRRIFDRFYRVEGELIRRTRGAGLGLAIAKMLADRMNMKIDVLSHQPGTEFCLILVSVD